MKQLMMALALTFFFPPIAYAAQVYGNIRDEERPAEPNLTIRIECEGGTYYDNTDSRGSYSVYVREEGRCTFYLTYEGEELSATIFSYDEPVKYDFQIYRKDDGSYALRRR